MDDGVYWFPLRTFPEDSGYRIRPKFHPDFASKLRELSDVSLEEYQATHPVRAVLRSGILPEALQWDSIMDAQRFSNEKQAMLKGISTKCHPGEVEIAQLFSYASHAGNPGKHRTPILQVLQ